MTRNLSSIPSRLLLLITCFFAQSTLAYGDALPQLSISDVTVSESSCSSQVATFTVSISAPFGRNVTVQFASADGTAYAGTDYTAVSGNLMFPRGSRAPQTITVPIADVLIPGPNKIFYVNLSHALNATISRGQGTATIDAPTTAKCQSCGLSCDDANGCTTDSCDAVRGCLHVNTSTVATPYCVLAGVNGPPDPNFAACHASGAWVDSDGDGFSDAEELQGYIDVNGNGVYDPGIDVPLLGADPHKADVYLHYDYFYASDHTHNPPPQAIQWMVDAFASRGINLHIDPQHNAIPESMGKVVTTQFADSPDPACVGSSATTMHHLREAYFPANYNLAYHYVVFSHWSYCDSSSDCNHCPIDDECGGGSPPPFGSYGESEIFGDDAIVSFGTLTDQGVQVPAHAASGVTMHELGHNFALLHGGDTCDNYKPNYLSVMSYNFYTTGIPVGSTAGDPSLKSCTTDADCVAPAHCSTLPGNNHCFRIDYSSARLPGLNESALYETAGLNESATSTDISIFTPDGITEFNIPTNGSPIDWNRDGVIESNVMQDINGDGVQTLLSGFNDWQNLQFSYQCGSSYDSGSLAHAISPFKQFFPKRWLAASRTQALVSAARHTPVLADDASERGAAQRGRPIDWLRERSW
jgi:hypothetical protein